MNAHDSYSDQHIRDVLTSVRSVAMLGASANENRPSFFVAKYLAERGYELFPINPGRAGGTIADVPVYASLADLPGPVDMIDVFRNASALPGIVGEIMQMQDLPKVVWMQFGLRDDAIAEALEMAGITVIQDRCPKVEYGRLGGEIGWIGYNRGTISAKKPTLAKGFQKLRL